MRTNDDNERLEALRKRLYARGQVEKKREHVGLSDVQKDVPTKWKKSVIKKAFPLPGRAKKPTTPAESVQIPESSDSPSYETPTSAMSPPKRKRTYRLKLLLAGLFFFVAAVSVSSFLILLGGNAISGENITITINGPFTIGGGEILPLQISVTNQNTVPVESATLIVEYPPGTQSADEQNRELFTERLSLDVIKSGETINVPVRAQIFGEENSEQTVRASIEYRVRGSNATFFREADPLVFKISSSPVAVSVEAIKNLASGQETDITLTLTSNSATKISDILIKAEYPTAFDFTRADPQPVSGQNVWIVDELESEASVPIVIKGLFTGSENEAHTINFSVGVPNEREPFNLASVFSAATAEFVIEQPFIDVSVIVEDVRNDMAAIAPGSQTAVAVVVENTLQNTIYDGEVELKLSGNALPATSIGASNGHYDSNTQTISWDQSSAQGLEKMIPGATERFSLTLEPDTSVLLTPQLVLDAVVRARRVSESDVQEEIVGTIQSVIKIESDIAVRSEVGYNVIGFNDTGPVPPVVGETTTYTVTWQVANGSNSISDAIVSATLPPYVSWLDNTSGNGVFTYNPAARTVEWEAGSVLANRNTTGSFQVSILPSASQADTTPTLVGEQRLRAEDDFAGSVLRASKSALTTELSREAGYQSGNGTVQ